VLPLLEVFQTSNRFFSLVDGVEFSPRSTGTFFSIELHFRLVVCKDGNENTISFAAVYVFYSNAETGDRKCCSFLFRFSCPFIYTALSKTSAV